MIPVTPKDDLVAVLAAAKDGDELVLADGTYLPTDTLSIDKDINITLRAQNSGRAVLDGNGTRRVLRITSGTVLLDGLNITKGHVSSVFEPSLNRAPLPRWRNFL